VVFLFGFSFFYLWVIQKIGGILVWFFLLLIIIGGFFTGYSFLKFAADYNTGVPNSTRVLALNIVGWSFVGLTFIFLCVCFFFRDRIRIAIDVVKESAESLEEMKSLVLFPFIPLVLILAYFIYWIYAAMLIFSVGDFVSNQMPPELVPLLHNAVTYKTKSWDSNFKKGFAAHFFHLLWNLQFIVYFTYLVVAVAIAHWYFTRRDPNTGIKPRGSADGQLTNFPMAYSMKLVIRYHLGTIAFSSLIIAVVEFVRDIILYFEKTCKKCSNNILQRCVFCFINCCMSCVKCCLDKISKNALVWTAIWGDAFVPASCSSFQLIWDNLARVAALNFVTAFLLFIGRVIVALLTTGFCGLILQHNSFFRENLTSAVMPLVVIFILSFAVATVFMIVFEATIDTIFLCFIIDEQHNAGGKGMMYASPRLQSLVNAHYQKSQEVAEQMKSVSGRTHTGQQQQQQQQQQQTYGQPAATQSGGGGGQMYYGQYQ